MQGSQASTYHLRRVALDRLEPSIPARYYYDPQHYERELEVFWYGMWVMAGREEEVPEPRHYKVVKIGTQSIVILRDLDGQLRAFHNTCRHRGSILCTEEQGRLPGRSLVCPYHTWTYGLDGQLVGTPRQMETAGFDRSAYPLFKVAVDTWGGFMFVNLAGERATPLGAALGDLPERFRNYGFADLRIGKRIVLDVKANWKLLFENFSECFHCPPVHPELCEIATLFWDAGAWDLRRDAAGTPVPSARPRFKPGAATLTMDGTARIPPFRGLTADERTNLYQSQIFRPNLFLNVHPDYVNSHQMLPTGPESVRMIYDWLFEPESLTRPEFDLDHYVALWDLTNRQDARNCEWQQEGLHARPLAHGNFVPQELGCHQFNQWVLESLGDLEGPGPTGASNGGSMTGMA
jgi:phenylpropionate dioxygenase-like ring-hydroxylating dioxygenase large terminal subunit